jgi:hypothetical protein
LLDQQNRVHRTDVALGVRNGENVEIVSGLELNQRIVGAGAAFLQDGEQVRTLAPPAPAATPGDGAANTSGPSLRGREG